MHCLFTCLAEFNLETRQYSNQVFVNEWEDFLTVKVNRVGHLDKLAVVGMW